MKERIITLFTQIVNDELTHEEGVEALKKLKSEDKELFDNIVIRDKDFWKGKTGKLFDDVVAKLDYLLL